MCKECVLRTVLLVENLKLLSPDLELYAVAQIYLLILELHGSSSEMHIIYFIWKPRSIQGNKIIFPPALAARGRGKEKSIRLIIFLLHTEQIGWGGSLLISAGGNWALKYWRSRKQIWKTKCVFSFMAEQHAEDL